MLDVLQIPAGQLFALLAAIGFAAGLNVYATVTVLGLLARFGHLPLPGRSRTSSKLDGDCGERRLVPG